MFFFLKEADGGKKQGVNCSKVTESVEEDSSYI
jgi:hypothetical protein